PSPISSARSLTPPPTISPLALHDALPILRTRRRRTRHAELLHLLDTADPQDRRMHVLAGPVPMAYCIPGRTQKVVLTDAALEVLDADEGDAVIEHERAHLRARHDLVLEAFTALHAAGPRWVQRQRAREA